MIDYTTPSTDLEAVNAVLSVSGLSPVNTLTPSSSTSPGAYRADVDLAEQSLKQESRRLQQKKWKFNTELGFPLSPDISDGNKIPVPLNVLGLNVCPPYDHLVLRGRHLYDPKAHTYVFERPVVADMSMLLPFEELPEPARNYVIIAACRKFLDNHLGTQEKHGFSNEDLQAAYADIEDYESRTGNYNLKRSPSVRWVTHRCV